MDLNQAEAYAKLFQDITSGMGIAVGGIWVYYKFVKGRLFSPKIELSLAEKVIGGGAQLFIALEVTLKNIGSIRLLPTSCRLEVTALSISDGNLVEHNISVPKGENILPFKNESRGVYYVDPGESTFRSTHFLLPSGCTALSVLVYAAYNKSVTERMFCVDLTKNSKG